MDQPDGVKAVRFRITGRYSKRHEVYYRVKNTGEGWSDWRKNNRIARKGNDELSLWTIQLKVDGKSCAPVKPENPDISQPVIVLSDEMPGDDIEYTGSMSHELLQSIANVKSEASGAQFINWFYKKYGGYTPYDMAVQQLGWCDRFSSWVLAQAGIRMPAGGCNNQADCYGEDFHPIGDGYEPKEGDLIFFDYDLDEFYDHVGVYYLNDGVPSVLHGNWGNRVTVNTMHDWTGVLEEQEVGSAIVGYGDTAAYAVNHRLK